MHAPSEERVGVLLIRAWLEGEERAIRIRLIGVCDIADPERTIAGSAGVEEAVAVVRGWLEGFARG